MLINGIIKLLQQAKKQYGNIEVRLHNTSDNGYYPINNLKLAANLKRHPVGFNIFYHTDRRWHERERIVFDNNLPYNVLYFTEG